MPTTQDDLARLARLMEARREWLGEKWTTIAERGGIQFQATYRLRKGQVSTPSVETKRGIEKGLRWPRGAVDDILAGRVGDELIERPAPVDSTQPASQSLEEIVSELPPEDQRTILDLAHTLRERRANRDNHSNGRSDKRTS